MIGKALQEGCYFTNSKEMARANPATWTHPTESEFAQFKEGQYVKFGINTKMGGERPWGIFLRWKDETTMFVQVNNDLVYTTYHGLRDDDIIELTKDQVWLPQF